ncbi:MAG: FAD-binding oxidoreductase [archaeon]
MNHKDKITNIATILKKNKTPVRFTKKTVSHKVPNPNSSETTDNIINISNLDQILEIDTENKTCTAEPGVTFSELTKATLQHNLTPIIVPELKEITIGGAVAGCSVESMSYKHGGFHDNCLEYELITAKGDVLECTPENNKDIFHMLHGTFGTLGMITKLKFKLIDAKPYVHLIHETHKTLEEYKKSIKDHFEKQDIDFMDGIIHSPEHYVLCTGNFTDNAPYTNAYDWMKIYHKSTAKRKEDYLKTYDYYFRYDADCHWISRNYGMENPILRFLLGKFLLSSTNMLSMANKLKPIFKHIKPDVIVDVFVPFSKWEEFSEFYNKELNDFPVWMVPYKIDKHYPWINEKHLEGIEDKLFIDLATYGMKQKDDRNYYRLIEEELMKVQGMKTLISHNFYTEDEFWGLWNKKNYENVKQKTDPDNVFGDLYSQTHPSR